MQQRNLWLVVILRGNAEIKESLCEALVGLLALKTALHHLAGVGREASIPEEFEGLGDQLVEGLAGFLGVFQDDVLMWVQILM